MSPASQRLLEQLEQAFHLHRTLEHLLNAVGLLGQGGQIFLEGGAVQRVFTFQLMGQLQKGAAAEQPGPQVDHLGRPVRTKRRSPVVMASVTWGGSGAPG